MDLLYLFTLPADLQQPESCPSTPLYPNLAELVEWKERYCPCTLGSLGAVHKLTQTKDTWPGVCCLNCPLQHSTPR